MPLNRVLGNDNNSSKLTGFAPLHSTIAPHATNHEHRGSTRLPIEPVDGMRLTQLLPIRVADAKSSALGIMAVARVGTCADTLIRLPHTGVTLRHTPQRKWSWAFLSLQSGFQPTWTGMVRITSLFDWAVVPAGSAVEEEDQRRPRPSVLTGEC
jgi:hypothetical protein